jgi:hypothetical protein
VVNLIAVREQHKDRPKTAATPAATPCRPDSEPFGPVPAGLRYAPADAATRARTVKALDLHGNVDVRLVQRDGTTVGTLVGVPARDPAKWARELVATATRVGAPVTRQPGFTLLPYGGGDVVAVGARGCAGILVSAATPAGVRALAARVFS